MDSRGQRNAGPYDSRPGRRALVASSLDDLRGPTAGVVELPHRMVWQAPPLRRFDLAQPYEAGRAYEIVLREAIRLGELRSYLNGGLLRRLWPDLHLPRGVRRAWEERFPELRQPHRAAA